MREREACRGSKPEKYFILETSILQLRGESKASAHKDDVLSFAKLSDLFPACAACDIWSM